MDGYGAGGMGNPAGSSSGRMSGRGGTGTHDDDLFLPCRVYTHARRHPVVIGNIQGLRIPPVTPAQLFVGIGSLAVLLMTQPLWAHLGGALNSLVMFAVPLGLAFAARALRVEGRAPWRAGLGWLMLAFAPRRGTRLGRPERPERAARRYRPRTWIAELAAPVEPPRLEQPVRSRGPTGRREVLPGRVIAEARTRPSGPAARTAEQSRFGGADAGRASASAMRGKR